MDDSGCTIGGSSCDGMDVQMRLLTIAIFLAGVGFVGYDEIVGDRRLSKTLRGEEGGLDISLVQEHAGFLTVLALVVFSAYLIDARLAIGLLILLLFSMIWVRGGI